MEPIQVYQTDEHGVYLPSPEPLMSDVLDGHQMIPAGCKTMPPPLLGQREAARTLGPGVDAGWEVVADWRGYTYYTADRVVHHITEVGVTPPMEHWDAPPPLTAVEQANARVFEIKQLLQQIDSDGARPAREIALALAAGGSASEAAISKVQSLEAQAQVLRTELATLNAVN